MGRVWSIKINHESGIKWNFYVLKSFAVQLIERLFELEYTIGISSILSSGGQRCKRNEYLTWECGFSSWVRKNNKNNPKESSKKYGLSDYTIAGSNMREDLKPKGKMENEWCRYYPYHRPTKVSIWSNLKIWWWGHHIE